MFAGIGSSTLVNLNLWDECLFSENVNLPKEMEWSKPYKCNMPTVFFFPAKVYNMKMQGESPVVAAAASAPATNTATQNNFFKCPKKAWGYFELA